MHTNVTDQQLVARYRQGDDDALERLVVRHDQEILNLAWRLVGQLDDAHDIRQTVWMQALQGLDRFRGEASFTTWMYRITVNACRDHHRRVDARSRHEQERTRTPSAALDQQVDRDAEQCERVRHAIGRLPPEQRESLVLRHYHGLRFDQIALVLNTPPSTARSRASRALEQLGVALSPTLAPSPSTSSG